MNFQPTLDFLVPTLLSKKNPAETELSWFQKDELKSHDRHQRHLKSTTEVWMIFLLPRSWLFGSRFLSWVQNVYECQVFRLVGTSCMSIILSM